MTVPFEPSARATARRDFCRATLAAAGGFALAPFARAADAAAGAAATASKPDSLGPWANVLAFGAVNDGRTKCTVAINGLIERLSAAGGGTVYFPAGVYLTGAIRLRSHITLYLDAGATIRFSEDFEDFVPMVPTRWQGLPMKNFSPLIFASHATNIAILGRGTLDGSGKVWWEYIKLRRQQTRESGPQPPSKWEELFLQNNPADADQSLGFHRPQLFQALECSDIRLEGVRFENSPNWTVHFVACENVVVDGVSVFAPHGALNTDGINPESSRHVRIANCLIAGHDDCIAIKSGKEPWGLANPRPSENITITNCVMRQGVAGVAIGSETSGGVRGVTVSNCVFDGTGRGVHIKTRRGRGGVIENVTVSNIVMRDLHGGVGEHRGAAVYVNMKYYSANQAAEPVGEGTPQLRNISISHIRGTNLLEAGAIDGLEEMPARSISLNDIEVEAEKGFAIANAEDVRLRDVRVRAKSGPALSCASVRSLALTGCRALDAAAGAPGVLLKDVQQALVAQTDPFDVADPSIAIEGAATRDIVLADAWLAAGPARVRVAADVANDQVRRP